MGEPSHDEVSISRQCRLLHISRSGWYYEIKGESPLNLKLMRLIDEQFVRVRSPARALSSGPPERRHLRFASIMETPYYGSRQMARHLRRAGYSVGRKRIRRLMGLIGVEALYQKPKTSTPHPKHRIRGGPQNSDRMLRCDLRF